MESRVFEPGIKTLRDWLKWMDWRVGLIVNCPEDSLELADKFRREAEAQDQSE